MSNVVRVATAVQALALPVIMETFSKGPLASTRKHPEDWAGIDVQVGTPKTLGLDVKEDERPRTVAYDFCNTALMDAVFPKVAKAIKKADGTELTHADFHKQMFELQSIVRTPKGQPMHQFRIGQFGDKKGRPALEAKPAKARTTKAKSTTKKARKAKAKVAA